MVVARAPLPRRGLLVVAAPSLRPLLRPVGETVGLVLCLASLMLFGGQHGPYPKFHRYEAEISAMATAIERYRDDCGALPARLQDLAVPVPGRGCSARVLLPATRLRDAWGGAYRYVPAGDRFELRSAGQDRVDYTPDDLVWGDDARPWRSHYRPPTDWPRLIAALATVLLAVLLLTKLLRLLWRGSLLLGRLLLRQRGPSRA